MMDTRLTSTLPPVVSASLLRFSLLAVLLASCATQATTEPAAAQPTAPAVILEPGATLVAENPAPTLAPTESAAATAVPVVTSRGPDLHATDPSTVSLASGQIQLVEFFRFT